MSGIPGNGKAIAAAVAQNVQPSPVSLAINPAAPVAQPTPITNSNEGINIPDGFIVNPGIHSIVKGHYVWLRDQIYNTSDNEGGSNPNQEREFVTLRKMAATVLPICANEQKFLLIRQFRFPAFFNSASNPAKNSADFVEDGWLYETIAGLIEPGSDPEETVIRESQEEGNGLIIDRRNLRKVHECLMTPGLTNEVIHIFLAIVDKTNPDGKSGLASEQELIRAKWMTRDEIRSLHNKGLIRDAKTLIALYAAKVL